MYQAPSTDSSYDKTKVELRCDTCGASFEGQAWMLKSKREINCRNCWLDKQDAI